MLLAAALAGLLVAAVIVYAELHRREGLYWYDVREDYVYRFAPEYTASVPVEVTENGVDLPPQDMAGATSFLAMRIRATLPGRWFEPCLELALGDATEVQCFERGASGLRYIVLPDAANSASRSVRIRGRHVDWEPQSARLLRFEQPRFADSRILVLAPHPDDAEIAAFGLYAAHDSWVVTITAGNYVDGLYGRLGLDAAAQDELRGAVRVWDSLAIPQLGGVSPSRTVNLGYLTYSLEAMFDSTDSAAGEPVERFRQGAVEALLGGRDATATWSSLVEDMVAVLQATRPDFVVTPHPALDDHADHKFTTLALLEALEKIANQDVTLLLYTNHLPLAEHHPYGPATAMVTLPPWFTDTRFASVLSHRLDDALQLRKLFALEAMHDLRAPPLRLSESAPASVFLVRLRQATDLVRRDPFGDYSYFRRAVRPNEVFFVYPPEARPSSSEAADWAGR